MPLEVGGDDLVALRQQRQHRREGLARHKATVQQDQRASYPMTFVVELEAVDLRVLAGALHLGDRIRLHLCAPCVLNQNSYPRSRLCPASNSSESLRIPIATCGWQAAARHPILATLMLQAKPALAREPTGPRRYSYGDDRDSRRAIGMVRLAAAREITCPGKGGRSCPHLGRRLATEWTLSLPQADD